MMARLRQLPSWLRAAAMAVALAAIVSFVAWSPRPSASTEERDPMVTRGPIRVDLSVGGVLEPAASITYRSPLVGRETEITFMAPEGQSVAKGDLLIRLDTSELAADLARATDARRDAVIAVQMAQLDVRQAEADSGLGAGGEGTLAVEEAQVNLRIAERRLDRVRSEVAGLKPLLERGFITRDELDKAVAEADEAEGAVQLARRRLEVLTGHSQPRERTRLELATAQKEAQLENAKQKLSELDAAITAIRGAIDSCNIYATAPGLVVYEMFAAASPQRKVRPGDRVTATQAILSIPEVGRMQLLSTIREADVRLVRPGQRADIAVQAYPDRGFGGRVVSIGTVARSSPDHPQDDKRFDVVLDVDATDVPLRPQMTARGDIHVAAESSALLVPLAAVHQEHGETVVYVVDRSAAVSRRPVRLNLTDTLHASVASGLREGERVRVADPPRQP